MPTISIFYGITIYLNLTRKEHNPPHVHAKYGDYNAKFTLSDGTIIEGEFPARAKQMVKEFITKYKKELQNMWDTETYTKLKGLD